RSRGRRDRRPGRREARAGSRRPRSAPPPRRHGGRQVISRVTGREAPHRPAPPPPTRLDVAECYRYCEAIVRSHHENFPVASRFLPERLRAHVSALYAFVRAADDFADEPEYEGRREAELDRWEDRLVGCFHGHADHPVFVALGATVKQLTLPIAPFSDLLQAFRLDITTRRYPSYGDLYIYTQRAAQPIGRLLLYVFGVRDPEAHRFADDLATALALTAFWQDIARDLGRDRIYLPQEDMRHFGVAEADLRAKRESRALADLVRFECARAHAYYLKARPLLDRVEAELLTEMALFWYGGARAGEGRGGGGERVRGAPHARHRGQGLRSRQSARTPQRVARPMSRPGNFAWGGPGGLGPLGGRRGRAAARARTKAFVLGKARARRGGLRVP